ncbi:MAG: hypothetical protein JST00_37520 [Deltaproteobacteria bacterium]|nr:hypothetical protein [Deltaproteobacteria bacterium]
MTHFVAAWQSGAIPEDAPANAAQLVDGLTSLLVAGMFAGSFATLPLAPILSLAKAGDAIDSNLRARVRIGLLLAGGSAVHLIALFLLFAPNSATAEVQEASVFVACAPSGGVLLFGLAQAVSSHRRLARLHDWVSRVWAGELAGVRLREEEGGDASLYVPDLVTEPSLDAVVLEAYADHPGDGPYRRKRSAVPLARVPRAWTT